MSEFDTAEQILENLCASLVNEVPKIDTAVKNLIAKFLSHPENADFYTESITSAKILLKEFKEVTRSLDNTIDWGTKNAQPENQSAEDRLSDIAKYKAVLFLCTKVDKPSKVFSKSFFSWSKCWPALKEKVLTKGAETFTPGTSAHDIFLAFIGEFALAVEEETYVDSDLVWAIDFTQALQKRQQRRTDLAKGRGTSSLHDEVRDAVVEELGMDTPLDNHRGDSATEQKSSQS
jgi:hypothetical protein